MGMSDFSIGAADVANTMVDVYHEAVNALKHTIDPFSVSVEEAERAKPFENSLGHALTGLKDLAALAPHFAVRYAAGLVQDIGGGMLQLSSMGAYQTGAGGGIDFAPRTTGPASAPIGALAEELDQLQGASTPTQ